LFFSAVLPKNFYLFAPADNRYWRIPYNVAVEIASPEALALREKEAPRHPPKAKQPPPMEDRAESPGLKADSGALSSIKRPKSRVETIII
jgi:hypothetical protein